ncbi:MAG: MarR family winged helix-turn-helix transcriptional regulator [Minisyncoccota bacterium]
MTKIISSRRTHSPHDVAHAMSLFSAIRRIMRTKLAKGKKLDPSTWVRIETLKFIADYDKPKMKDIANYLSITAPSATSLVGDLMKKELVTSYTDLRDRRTSRLALTKKGKTELKKAVTRGTEILGKLFAALPEEEFTAFTHALEQIKKAATE